MWISGRVVRIPLPQMRAGFKDRWKKRVRSRRDGSGIRLRGSRSGARRLRRGVRETAALYRSWPRWVCVFVLWAALFVGAFLVPPSRFSLWHFGLMVAFGVSLFAAFARHPAARTVMAGAIVTAAGLCAGWAIEPEVSLVVALAAFGLFIQNALRF